jgi:hypothetical protein
LIHLFVAVFSAATPNFRCRIAACDGNDATFDDASNNHFDKFSSPDQCFQFRFVPSTKARKGGELDFKKSSEKLSSFKFCIFFEPQKLFSI